VGFALPAMSIAAVAKAVSSLGMFPPELELSCCVNPDKPATASGVPWNNKGQIRFIDQSF